MADEKQDGQKTLVAFVVGLLIGGMLVWAFSGPTTNAPTEDVDEASQSESDDSKKVSGEKVTLTTDTESSDVVVKPELSVGDGKVSVKDQAASATIALDSATYPISEGWIGVREYNNENLGFLLGAVRFSESQGLVPSEIELLRSTSAGNTYAIVIYTENGDLEFSLDTDVQIDTVFDTFIAK